ncbi:hypothetical protein JAAARDRAFT_142476 [Jaapia argillacea MUCL 33604]|uniref:Uncharacterized protein n=1 Tax=Jaapia argillacea MUCL 33604 TaxID=933084 RepID=A0A067P5Q3_9AGAM|nr:hypothetical protein JAAARDRAFT_142476 [Jaapia argillacea MUCL 33604]
MPRELRTRRSRPNYATLFAMPDDEADTGEVGPSSKQSRRVIEEEVDSGSDFAPEHAVEAEGEVEEDDSQTEGEDEDQGQAELEGEEDDDTKLSKFYSASSAPRTFKTPTMYTLPIPSVHHRHRAVPIHHRAEKVERLTRPPGLFEPVSVVPANSYTSHTSITDKVNKAWGFNVGAGPLWDLMEDRTWFKESLVVEGEEWKEGNRRPVVYPGVTVLDGWEILSPEEAVKYLPSDTMTTDEGVLKPPPPVPCYFGPFGKQTRVEMKMFESQDMSELLPESKAQVFNAGAPVWGIDWCPIHPDERPHRSFKQYLAVTPFPSISHSPEIGEKSPRPSPACIQLWSFGPRPESGADKGKSGVVKCEMVLCVDCGPGYEVKWCPLPSHDLVIDENPRKLGLLAGTFGDGSLSIFVVPDPEDLQSHNTDNTHPIYVRVPEPLIRIELEDSACLTFDWANSEVIAVGTSNGIFSIAVYDIGEIIRNRVPSADILPTHYLNVHQSAIRGLVWVPAPPSSATGVPLTSEDPTVLASGGYDGVECFTDIREPHPNVFNRTRDVVTCMAYSVYGGGAIAIDHENIIKVYQASPSMLGRGHYLMEPGGPVWSVSASDYHPQLAVGSADGVCATTNGLKSTRRGGSVPFFVHKIYQLDYSRKTKEFRMLDRFLPQETQDRASATRAKRKDSSVQITPVGTGAWSAEVSIQRVAWNSGNGMGCAGMLASATGSGLCRIDWVWGRWMKGKVPYGGVESMRKEGGGGEEDEEDEED